MSIDPETAPGGCVGCNPEEVQPLLDRHGIQVEAVPAVQHGWSDVVVCPRCGQAWLLMPRATDKDTPSA